MNRPDARAMKSIHQPVLPTILCFLCSALLSITPPAAAQPRSLLFEFDGTNDGEWTPITGVWEVSGGRYHQTEENGMAVTTLPYLYEDLDIQGLIDIGSVGGPEAFAGFRIFGVDVPGSDEGYAIGLTPLGPVVTSIDGSQTGASEPIPDPTGPHSLYWEYIAPRSIARLDNYPDVNGWDCAARSRIGLVQLITYNCSASFDEVRVSDRSIYPSPTPDARPTPTLPVLSERAFYCPAATTGAGGSLLKFWTAGSLDERISHFSELPGLLEDARRFGANMVYLVDWWDGGYSNKGDYIVNQSLGGEAAFRDGIDAIHAQGGKIVLYLEPFIIHRTRSLLGQSQQGQDWSMQDAGGIPYGYYGDTSFYLMYPGEGSGWAEYFSDLCGNLARDYQIDGVYLDSYGIQWNWKDYNPLHPGAEEGSGFNAGVVDLIQQTRDKIREHVPAAVIWLEGSEFEPLLQMVNGSQIESLDVYLRKPWWAAGMYSVFIAEYDLRSMRDVLQSGALLGCNDFYFSGVPSDSDFNRMRAGVEWGGARELQQRFWKMVNVAYANGIDVPAGVADPEDIDCLIVAGQYQVPPGEDRLEIPQLTSAVDAYAPLLAPLRGTEYRLPADQIRDWLVATPRKTGAIFMLR